MKRRQFLVFGMAAVSTPAWAYNGVNFKPIPTQFLAALGDPAANSGTGAETWGLWTVDPGPRGVRLDQYDQLIANGNVAPAQWKFDPANWWLEEHGLIMEQPAPSVPAGRYLVTGDRKVETVLTIYPKDANGAQRWGLAQRFMMSHICAVAQRATH